MSVHTEVLLNARHFALHPAQHPERLGCGGVLGFMLRARRRASLALFPVLEIAVAGVVRRLRCLPRSRSLLLAEAVCFVRRSPLHQPRLLRWVPRHRTRGSSDMTSAFGAEAPQQVESRLRSAPGSNRHPRVWIRPQHPPFGGCRRCAHFPKEGGCCAAQSRSPSCHDWLSSFPHGVANNLVCSLPVRSLPKQLA